jgi:hypothetical protein
MVIPTVGAGEQSASGWLDGGESAVVDGLN